MPDCYIRAFAWRGSEALGVTAMNNTIHLAIANWEWPSYFDPAQRLKGIRLDLADYRRPDPKHRAGDGQGLRPLCRSARSPNTSPSAKATPTP